MTESAKRNLQYVFWMLFLCGIVPHAALSAIHSQSGTSSFSPVERDAIRLFFTREWIVFWAVFLSYRRLQKMDRFLISGLCCFFAIMLTFLPRCEKETIMALGLNLPLMLVLETSGLLCKLEQVPNKLLAGVAANRGMIRAFFFWAVVVPCVLHISCAWTNGIVVPLILLPIPAVLLVSTFRQLNEEPPAFGAIVGVLLMLPITYVLTTTGPMENFETYHMLIFMGGYVLFFLFQGIYHMDHWRKTNKSMGNIA